MDRILNAIRASQKMTRTTTRAIIRALREMEAAKVQLLSNRVTAMARIPILETQVDQREDTEPRDTIQCAQNPLTTPTSNGKTASSKKSRKRVNPSIGI